MSLDGNVIPGVLAALKTVTGSGPGQIRSLHYGEQFQVQQAPVAWLMAATAVFPEAEGSELERSDWSLELRLLYPWTADQRNAELQLNALIEPIRGAFRGHLKLSFPPSTNYPGSNIARARVLQAQWLYMEIGRVVYRTVVLTIGVREKQPVTFQP